MKNKVMQLGLKTYYVPATILKFSGIVLVVTSLVILMYKTVQYNFEISAKNEKINAISPLVDSIEYHKKLQRRAFAFVDNYFALTNNNNYKELLTLYADNVDKFYSKRNVPHSQIEREMMKHQQRVPFDSVSYNPNEMIVSELAGEKCKIILPSLYSKDPSTIPFEPIYIVIILNKFDQIVSISNYKDVNAADL